MKNRLVRIVLVVTIFTVLITQIFSAQSEEPGNTVGVANGDTFDFQLTQLLRPFYDFTVIGADFENDVYVVIHEGDGYSLTVSDDSIQQTEYGYDFLEVEMSDAEASTVEKNLLMPGYSYVAFTNWEQWELIMGADPIAYWGADFNNQTITNEPTQFVINVWWKLQIGSYDVDYNEIHRYDKADGVVSYVYTEMHPFGYWNMFHSIFEAERVDYVLPEPPVDEPTTTTVTTTTTEEPSDVTTTEVPSDVTTETSTTVETTTTIVTTTTVPTTEATTDVTTTVETTTTTRTIATTTIPPRTETTTTSPTGTITPAETTTTRTLATSTTAPRTETTTTTTTAVTDTSTRTIVTSTPTTTIDRTSDVTTTTATTTTEQTSEGSGDSPGFGLILSLSAFIAIVIIFKRKNY